MSYLYIVGCILFTVYGQLILKWRMNQYEVLPVEPLNKVFVLVKLILVDPYILSSFVAAFLASLFWMAAMTKFPLSFAYPFMSSAFVIVILFSVLFFGEALNFYKLVGIALIIAGMIVLSHGYST